MQFTIKDFPSLLTQKEKMTGSCDNDASIIYSKQFTVKNHKIFMEFALEIVNDRFLIDGAIAVVPLPLDGNAHDDNLTYEMAV